MRNIKHFFRSLLEPADSLQLASWLFLKLLALIYLAAFLSLAVQITGLVGPDGILPYQDLLDRVYAQYGRGAWWRVPTLFWFDAGNAALQGVAWLGAALSLLLLLGRSRRWLLLALFVLYLSLFHAGQEFLNFQWDSLLLESGFLAIFLANGPTRLVILLYHWLLFRFRFMSGAFKLLSGDPSWSGFTALNHYFETQPLPHMLSWYAHQLPEWMLKAGVGLVFFTELIVPFFIFLPRRFRIFAAVVTIAMQLLIIATSNHAFVNLLVIVLCVLLLDDGVVERLVPRWLKGAGQRGVSPGWPDTRILPLAGVLILLTSLTYFTARATGSVLPPGVAQANQLVRAWGVGHIYHIFPTMQIERQELVIEGSYDGQDWRPYVFRYKPGPLDRRPEFIVPHHPRLDWLIWFVPTQHPQYAYWFNRFMHQLWSGSKAVAGLLEHNPFAERPPRYLRVLAYRYRFTTPQERAATGRWWAREYLGEFPNVPPRHP